MVISARISFGAKCVEISLGFDAKSLSKGGSFKKKQKKHQILAPTREKKTLLFRSVP